MGNDGGSIPKRRELVREAARAPNSSELKATLLENLAHLWAFCPLTSEPLAFDSTVSDSRGRLYNYESILQCLAPSDADAPLPESQVAEFERTGIRGLKDIVRLRFHVRKEGGSKNGKEVRACPISMKELGSEGSPVKAVYVVPCGHVFSEVAMRETTGLAAGNGSSKDTKEAAEKQCPECSGPFLERDVIPILPVDETEVDRLGKRMDELKTLGLTHSLKKDKSGGKKKRKAEGEETNGSREKAAKTNGSKEKNGGIDSRINNAMTASLTAKVLAEQEERNKRRKMAETYKSEPVR
ncbi:Rtf2 RING-finger-domain-containing protein [Microdochium trichocladiopsis]|uniref:Rtf2 RING-finger-domain-containing protein n=1 Tax=Microdochium trichocladiopsis TaxID=1682393 RepID=A0A9P8XVC2_9PEZI|nr:Rtf2 RING-finger-domain-containing protein [Microdochium trichocladiopsis]KAH7020853.1 Rtf2 RING-finger-domain-containing protein [Microdochium trichocladiopsis]